MGDKVNHPVHYNGGRIECIEFLEDQRLGFHLGNAVKYIVRAGKKDPAKTVEDLEKAVPPSPPAQGEQMKSGFCPDIYECRMGQGAELRKALRKVLSLAVDQQRSRKMIKALNRVYDAAYELTSQIRSLPADSSDLACVEAVFLRRLQLAMKGIRVRSKRGSR